MKKYLIIVAALLTGTSAFCNADALLPPPSDAKEIDVTKILYPVTQPVEIPEIFAKEGIEYHSMSNIPFGRSYKDVPKVSFAIAYTDDAILIHYRVSEASRRAVAVNDNDHVWEDSCCEFFSAPDESDGYYYNLEANCAAKILIECGTVKTSRENPSKEVMESVKRWSTYQGQIFDGIAEPSSWQMTLIIPFRKFYFNHNVESLDGRTMRANFYKCGDFLPSTCVLTWSPLYAPAKHLHAPNFFGTLHFVKP